VIGVFFLSWWLFVAGSSKVHYSWHCRTLVIGDTVTVYKISFLLTTTISTWTLMTLGMPKYHQKMKKGLFEEKHRRSETYHHRRPPNQPVPDLGMPRLPSVLPPSTSCCRSVSRGGRVAVTGDSADQRIATWGGKLYYTILPTHGTIHFWVHAKVHSWMRGILYIYFLMWIWHMAAIIATAGGYNALTTTQIGKFVICY